MVSEGKLELREGPEHGGHFLARNKVWIGENRLGVTANENVKNCGTRVPNSKCRVAP